jgi:bacterioferritin-associated ferredoxin
MKSANLTSFQVKHANGVAILEIDSHDRIVRVQGLSLELVGLPLGKALTQKNLLPSVDIAFKLRAQAYVYWGVEVFGYEKKNSKESSLVCRCRGVYREEIFRFVEKKSASGKVSLNELCETLNAGVTCLSCSEDVEEAWQQALDQTGSGASLNSRINTDGTFYRPLGMTPARFLLAVHDKIEQWTEREGVKGSAEIIIVDIIAYRVYVQLNGVSPEKHELFVQALEDYLKSELAASIQVSLRV